jgi:hypothetical protein
VAISYGVLNLVDAYWLKIHRGLPLTLTQGTGSTAEMGTGTSHQDVELTERPRAGLHEQRRASRKILRLTAQITLPDGAVLSGQTADVSREGIGFFSPSTISAGCDCTLSIAISACGTSAELHLVGRVCHCSKVSEDRYRVGMKFIRMDEATAAVLCAAMR